jgi:hypothetical protein
MKTWTVSIELTVEAETQEDAAQLAEQYRGWAESKPLPDCGYHKRAHGKLLGQAHVGEPVEWKE